MFERSPRSREFLLRRPCTWCDSCSAAECCTHIKSRAGGGVAGGELGPWEISLSQNFTCLLTQHGPQLTVMRPHSALDVSSPESRRQRACLRAKGAVHPVIQPR
eukprot:scaffold23154_cov67-Phaeocystis_antarctica.AAC.2